MNASPLHSSDQTPSVEAWYRGCHWLCRNLYFARVGGLWAERIPARGPVLYIGLHRNGAVDGFLYHSLVPRGVFLVSTQLRKSFFARLFFGGIAIARKNDAAVRGENEEALAECGRLLAGGGELVIFPEGTSSLGPRHLPFKTGAARIAVDALEAGIPLNIVPLGIHYERAWQFRSNVEVVVGETVATDFPAGLSDLGKLKEMKRRMDRALEAVGVNFASPHDQVIGEQLAYASTLTGGCSYFRSLKSLETGIPPRISENWKQLSSHRAARYQGVPSFSRDGRPPSLLCVLLSAPVVLVALILNFPPLALAWLAARRLADAKNVIALWRIMIGLPALLMWSALMSLLIAFSVGSLLAMAYLILTITALKIYPLFRKRSIEVWNEIFHQSLREPVTKFLEELSRHLSRE